MTVFCVKPTIRDGRQSEPSAISWEYAIWHEYGNDVLMEETFWLYYLSRVYCWRNTDIRRVDVAGHVFDYKSSTAGFLWNPNWVTARWGYCRIQSSASCMYGQGSIQQTDNHGTACCWLAVWLITVSARIDPHRSLSDCIGPHRPASATILTTSTCKNGQGYQTTVLDIWYQALFVQRKSSCHRLIMRSISLLQQSCSLGPCSLPLVHLLWLPAVACSTLQLDHHLWTSTVPSAGW